MGGGSEGVRTAGDILRARYQHLDSIPNHHFARLAVNTSGQQNFFSLLPNLPTSKPATGFFFCTIPLRSVTKLVL